MAFSDRKERIRCGAAKHHHYTSGTKQHQDTFAICDTSGTKNHHDTFATYDATLLRSGSPVAVTYTQQTSDRQTGFRRQGIDQQAGISFCRRAKTFQNGFFF
jgi:hypothetical protein